MKSWFDIWLPKVKRETTIWSSARVSFDGLKWTTTAVNMSAAEWTIEAKPTITWFHDHQNDNVSRLEGYVIEV